MRTDLSSPRPLTYIGLFLVALSTLTHQVLLTRIFSVTMWYHFAFVAISIAMFGMTAGALLAYAWRPPAEKVRTYLALSAIAYPMAIVFSFLTQLSIPFLMHPSIVAAYAIAFTIVVIAVPFVVSGICVSLTLTHFSRRVSGLYASDLAGAALGCLAVIALLKITDAATAVIAVAAFAGLGAIAFAIDAGQRRLVTAATTIAVLLSATAGVHTAFVWHQFPVLRILYIKGQLEARPLYEKWNSYSRVRVNGYMDVPEAPYGWGLSSKLPADLKVRQLRMDIDVSAGTVMTAYHGDPAEVAHLKYDVTNAGYYIRPGPNVAIIGAGGGRDVLSALTFGAKDVTAIEINTDILRIVNEQYGDFTGHLDRDPRVHFVNDEARSYLARQGGRFDMLQISLIDTWAATAAGAFVMSENSLYTREAWKIFLSCLSDTGVLSVSRWYSSDRPGEIYRMVALASAALKDAGIASPQQHMLLIRNIRATRDREQPESVGTLLVSRSAFSADDVARLRGVARGMDFEMVLDGQAAPDPVLQTLTSGGDVEAFARTYPINIAPPTDDSPFFFQMLRLRDLANISLLKAGKNQHNMQAVFVLGILMITVIVLGATCLVVPRVFTRPRERLDAIKWYLLYFAAIGLGFMLIEVSLMPRLIVVLGHPTYGLSVVLFALLLGSGVGSFLTRGVSDANAGRVTTLRLLYLLAALVVIGFVLPWLLTRLQAESVSYRAITAAVFLFGIGLLMGQAFPLGMKLAAGKERLTLWLWGVNGAMSVCASVLAVVIALSVSISAAFATGALAYALAMFAASRIRPQTRA